MNAFGLLLYLLIFLIPVGPGTLCDYLWQRSPEWMPALTLHSMGGMLLNVGFYAVMLGSWVFFLLIGRIIAGALERDDTNWRTVFGPFESRGNSILWDLGLLLLGGLSFLWLLWNHLPIYEMVALSLPVAATLGIGLLRKRLRKHEKASLASSNRAGSGPTLADNTDNSVHKPGRPLLMAPRNLREDEPKPLSLDNIVRHRTDLARRQTSRTDPKMF
jgi:hypothetical protein